MWSGASFISALVQIARARELLKPTDPVFTGMFSFGAPTNPDTLRDWIDDLVALRFLLATKQGDPRIEKLRDALLKKDDDHGIEIADEDDLLAVLANSNLPDVIAADQGAIARKIGGPNGPNLYKFLGGREDVPTVMVLIDQFVEQLGTSATPGVQGALAVLRAHLAIDLVVDPVRFDEVTDVRTAVDVRVTRSLALGLIAGAGLLDRHDVSTARDATAASTTTLMPAMARRRSAPHTCRAVARGSVGRRSPRESTTRIVTSVPMLSATPSANSAMNVSKSGAVFMGSIVPSSPLEHPPTRASQDRWRPG